MTATPAKPSDARLGLSVSKAFLYGERIADIEKEYLSQ